MPKNLAENMASERPICECGHGPTFHHNPIGYCEHTCACSDYRPAPAATTPERDAMPLSEAIEELRIRANQERYLERRRQRDGQDNTGARVVRAIDTVLAALTPRDEPAAATDGTLEARIMALPENGKVIAFTSDSNPFCNAQFTHAELKALVARRADPTPEVRRRIEERFAKRFKARLVDEFGEPRFYDPDDLRAAMEAELGESK
jgi:hypothetical protein